jgi:hypothetical protein
MRSEYGWLGFSAVGVTLGRSRYAQGKGEWKVNAGQNSCAVTLPLRAVLNPDFT